MHVFDYGDIRDFLEKAYVCTGVQNLQVGNLFVIPVKNEGDPVSIGGFLQPDGCPRLVAGEVDVFGQFVAAAGLPAGAGVGVAKGGSICASPARLVGFSVAVAVIAHGVQLGGIVDGNQTGVAISSRFSCSGKA